MFEAAVQDIRYGVRQLWRSPAFTIAALTTLALGIGANTALFTLFQAMLIRPMTGVQQSDRLIWITGARAPDNFPVNISYPDFLEYRDGLRNMVDLSVTSGGRFALSSGGQEPERVHGEIVSGNYFSILRTPFALGRGFVPGEDSVGQSRNVVVLSHTIWQTRFNGDSAIVGKSVVVNGQPLTVVGVTMEGFNGPDLELPRHVYLPAAQYHIARPELADDLTRRGAWWLRPVGRLHDGVTRAQVEAAAKTIAARIAAADTSGHKGISARTYSAKSGLPSGSDREVIPVVILCSIVTGLVLLIACANVSNLLLARAVTRRREIGIRLSLGAGRLRLVRQLLTESLLLASGAGVLGLILAYWSTDFLITSGILPLQLDMRPDSGVIVFALAGAVLASILFGLVPAFESTRGDLVRTVKDGAQSRDPRRTRLQSSFVVTQLALSLVLLTTSGLFLRSMYKASHVDIGFEATPRVLAMSFDLGLQRYSDENAAAFVRSLQERARGLPEVETVSLTNVAPLGNRYLATELSVEGADSARMRTVNRDVFESSIRPNYFATLGIRLLRGRDFTDRDDLSSPAVAIVSEATARTFWPEGDAIGKRISLRGEQGPYVTVVGVVSDVLLGGPTEGMRATVYVPQLQYPNEKLLTLLVRSRVDVTPLAQTLRQAIRAMDPNLPVYDVHTLAEYRRIKLADRMNGATILGGFGGLALLLASIGVYGVMAFTVVQRTKEIGIRVALGARRSDVIALFVGRGMRLTVIGLVIGVVLSLGMSKLLQGMLFGLTPTDALTFAGVAGLLAGIALLASWLPARRAARVEAIQALRYE
jgi:predicted permease